MLSRALRWALLLGCRFLLLRAQDLGGRLFTVPSTGSSLRTSPIPSLFQSAGSSNWTFRVRPHPVRPASSFLVTYEGGRGDERLQLNYTDLDAATLPGRPVLANPSRSVLLAASPFALAGLSPGHKYRLLIAALRPDGPPLRLHTQTLATHPKAPAFSAANISSSEYSITLKGRKDPADSLQDQFVIQYTQLDPPVHAFDPVTVPDIAEQPSVELFLNGLSPGVSYNLTVTAYRNFTPSAPWQAIVTTAPLEPVLVRVAEVGERSVRLAWRRPPNSGLDSYALDYRLDDGRTPGSPGTLADDPAAKAHSLSDVQATEATLSEGLVPGRRYALNLYSSKSGQRSQPAQMDFVTRPLPPVNISVRADLISRKFPVKVTLGESAGDVDVCVLRYVPESQPAAQTANYTEPVKERLGEPPFCLYQLPLQPGLAYVFTAWTSSQDTPSASLERRVPVRPGFDMDILGMEASASHDEVRVVWRHHDTANWAPVLDIWRLMVAGNLSGVLQGPGLASPLRASENPLLNPTPTPLVFKGGLSPGTCYQLSLYTTTPQGIASARSWEGRVRTSAPQARLGLGGLGATFANLSLTLDDPTSSSSACSADVVAKNSSGQEVFRRRLPSLSEPAQPVLVRNLSPYHKYSVSGLVRCDEGEVGDEGEDACAATERTLNSVELETPAGRPSAPRQVKLAAKSPSEASLSWQRPARPNGQLTGYVVRVRPVLQSHTPHLEPWTVEVAGESNLEARLGNLTGGLRYRISVAARTAGGLGDEAVAGPSQLAQPHRADEWVAMPVAAPPKPRAKPLISQEAVRQTDLSVSFDLSSLSAVNGILLKYAIVVAEVSESHKEPRVSRNLSWHEVAKTSFWEPYVALEKPLAPALRFAPGNVTEHIGVDSACTTWAPGDRRLCNGPLRAGKAYRVALRAYTTPTLFTDSEFSRRVRTEAGGLGSGGKGVVGALVGLLCVAFLALAALFLLRRYPPSGWRDKVRVPEVLQAFGRRGAASLGQTGVTRPDSLGPVGTLGGPAGGQGAVYGQPIHQHEKRERAGKLALPQLPTIQGPHLERSRAVKVAVFPEHVRLMSADSDFRFSEEFEDLKGVGRGLAATAADLPVNRPKNRFTNILPFDHSRVKLVPIDDEDGSDFVNANYIPGFNSKREFIAAQGPLASTRDDFWRMVWEQQCPAVINLTRCVEKGREKCDQYWPLGAGPTAYGELELSLLNETRTPDWTLREFRLTSLADPSLAPRTLRHFHYHAWPDFGVPERPSSIVHFLRSFRSKVPADRACKPTVVHCSAGVGRSGTLISVDRLMQEVAAGAEEVDVFGIVNEMRRERCQMVQTEQQYICIHHCLLAVLQEDSQPRHRAPEVSAPYPMAPYPVPVSTPRVAVHQNPAFEDDEGIAESGPF